MKLVWGMLSGLAFAATGWTVEIIAHRGASAEAPENTLAAVRLAWQQKADAVEVDVHLTRDGRVVVLHDDNTKRTAGLDRAISELNLAEIKLLDAGKWKGARWEGERIPELEEVLAALPPGKRLFVEIKCGPEILPVLEQILARAGTAPEQVVLIGFSHETMRLARNRFPRLQIYWLSGFERDRSSGVWRPSVEELVQKARAASFDGLNVSAQGPVDAGFARQVRERDLRLFVWTVNEAERARELAEAGVEGITTDKPGWVREQLARGE